MGSTGANSRQSTRLSVSTSVLRAFSSAKSKAPTCLHSQHLLGARPIGSGAAGTTSECCAGGYALRSGHQAVRRMQRVRWSVVPNPLLCFRTLGLTMSTRVRYYATCLVLRKFVPAGWGYLALSPPPNPHPPPQKPLFTAQVRKQHTEARQRYPGVPVPAFSYCLWRHISICVLYRVEVELASTNDMRYDILGGLFVKLKQAWYNRARIHTIRTIHLWEPDVDSTQNSEPRILGRRVHH
jgi:hypothetical protein